MASSIRVRRARYLVLGCFLIVLAVTLRSFLSHRGVSRRQPPPPTPMAKDVGQQTQAFSLSKTVGEHAVYTIRADQVTNYEDTGKALLHGVAVLIYGKDGSRRDSITSPECVYDPAGASIWMPGEVEMQFDLPLRQRDTSGTSNPPSSAPVSIRTSQLSFDQHTGVASTKAAVQFRLAQGEGSSLGAAYDPQKQVLLLNSQVSFTVGVAEQPGTSVAPQEPAASSGSMRPVVSKPVPGRETTHIRAETLRFDRQQGRVLLEKAVEVSRGLRTIRAAHGELVLDEAYQVQEARLDGGLRATEESATGIQLARAETGTVWLNKAGRFRSVVLEQDVEWSAHSLAGSIRRAGRAQHVEFSFTDPGGSLDRILAEGNVQMSFPGELPRSTAAHLATPPAAETHNLIAGRAEMLLAPDGKTLRQVRMRAAPRLEIIPARAGEDRRTVTAEEFEIGLDERGELNQFRAQEHVRFVSEDTGALARRRETTSDGLEATFDSSSGSLERVRQWGHFQYRDPERQARAEEADYSASQETIVLRGRPQIWNSDGRLAASRIELETPSGGLLAEGDVSSTWFPKPAPRGSAREPIQAVSERLRYESATKRAHFQGHARLWQGENFLLEADSLDWSPPQGELVAREKVYSVFRQMPAGGPNGHPTPPPAAGAARRDDTITIRADLLRYQQPQRLAQYRGAVRVQNASGIVTAAELDIFLTQSAAASSPDFSLRAGEIERAVAEGQVRVEASRQAGGPGAGRIATADRAEFLPSRGEARLYGQPARATYAVRGSVEGPQLTYFLGNDRIQVQGNPGTPTETRWQVDP